MGKAYFKLGAYEKAMTFIYKAIELDENFLSAYILLINILTNLNNID